jgi:signal transduction histidine kinase
LLENTLKFTQAHDTISVSASTTEHGIHIKILDTGIGIPVEDLPKMFKRFHRGRNVSQYAGNGLGLAIVKAIAIGHGGEVNVASEGLDKGSLFTLTLPAN